MTKMNDTFGYLDSCNTDTPGSSSYENPLVYWNGKVG